MCEPYKPQYWFLENCYIFSVFNSQAIKKNVAIQTGDMNILKKVLKAGVIKPSYDTILSAAQLGNLQIVEELLEYKDVFPLSSELFGAACESGNVQLITYLEKIGCEPCDNCLVRIIGNNPPIETINYAFKYLKQYDNQEFINYNTILLTSAIGTGNFNNVKFVYNALNMNNDYYPLSQPVVYAKLTPMAAACHLPFNVGESIIKYLLCKGFVYDTSVLPWSDSNNNNDFKDIVKVWKIMFEDNNFHGGVDNVTTKKGCPFIKRINQIFDTKFLKKHNFYIC